MALIDVEETVAQALRAHADARNMSLQEFLRRIAESAAPVNSPTGFALADFEKAVDELSSESPVLPGKFSRADIYLDHD